MDNGTHFQLNRLFVYHRTQPKDLAQTHQEAFITSSEMHSALELAEMNIRWL